MYPAQVNPTVMHFCASSVDKKGEVQFIKMIQKVLLHVIQSDFTFYFFKEYK